MIRNFSLVGIVLAGVAALATADDRKIEHKAVAKQMGLQKLKALAGEWVELDKDGKQTDKVVSVFKVTAGGSAVIETIMPGSPYEMVSVYHLDGKDLVMTHYCAAKNQPRMKADPAAPANKLVFKFAGGTNFDPAKDMHIHEGSITIIDDNTIEWTWQGWSGGKAAEDHTMSKKLGRKK